MPKYCYSYDEEAYYGEEPTREAALAEAISDADEHTVCWIAECVPSHTMLRPNSIGDRVHEFISECLADQIGGDDDPCDMTGEQETTLGQVVIDWLLSNGCLTRYGVKDRVQHDISAED